MQKNWQEPTPQSSENAGNKPNYMINVILDSPRLKKQKLGIKEATEELDSKMESMFNRVQYLQGQITNYEAQNDSIKDQMASEIEKNKEVEDIVNESISNINGDLHNLNEVVVQIGNQKAFLEKAIGQIKLSKLVQMENSFLKNENTLLKENIEELKNVIQKYQENEQELIQVQENLQQKVQDIEGQNEFIKNAYAINNIKQLQVDQQFILMQAQHRKLLADYEMLEEENKKLKAPQSSSSALFKEL